MKIPGIQVDAGHSGPCLSKIVNFRFAERTCLKNEGGGARAMREKIGRRKCPNETKYWGCSFSI